MMTKKDFIEIANFLAYTNATQEQIDFAMNICQQNNPRFDRQRFQAWIDKQKAKP